MITHNFHEEYYKGKAYKSDKAFMNAIIKAIESIKGKGYANDILSIHYKGKSIEQHIIDSGRISFSEGENYFTYSGTQYIWYDGIDVDIDSHIYFYCKRSINE